MDRKDFIDFGKTVIDFIANYTETLRDRNVLSVVEPRYLFKLLPEEAPQKPERWQQMLQDVERYILPGSHFQASYLADFFGKIQSRRPVILVNLKYNEIFRNIGVAMSKARAYSRRCASNEIVSRTGWDRFPEFPSHPNYLMGGNQTFWNVPQWEIPLLNWF